MKNIPRSGFIIFFILAFCKSFNIKAQPNNNMLPADAIPAPNAAALGKYGDIPVSYFTGVPDISIPIHTLKEGPLSLAVSISYHAGGNKPVEIASWVGMGWSLNAGGMISRTVQGIPDEYAGGYYHTGHLLPSTINPTQNTPENNVLFWEINNQVKDSEPDIFSFNVGGYSGKFYIDSKNAPSVGRPKYNFYPKQDLMLEFDDPFDYFTLITPDGIRYTFGRTIINGLVKTAYEASNSVGNPNPQPYRTSWYLLKVESYDLKFFISLEYDQEEYYYYSPLSCTYWAYAHSWCGGVQCCITGSQPCISSGMQCALLPGPDVNHKAQQIYVIGRRLKNIKTSFETVNFLPSPTNRADIDFNIASAPTKFLDYIEIVTGSGICKKFDLTHDYFQDPGGTASYYKHLRLTGLSEMSCDGSILNEPYTFTYNGDFMAHRLSKAVDHWGYYNGVTANETIDVPIPTTTVSGGAGGPWTYGGSNREPNETEVKKGMLTEIKYPTGGKTTFIYESNQARAPVSTPTVKVDLKSCPLSLPQCCGNQEGNSSAITFTAAELNDTKFWVRLDRVYSSSCYASQNVNVQVSAFNYPSGTPAGYIYAFNLPVGVDWDTTVWRNITDIITNPVAGQQYTFKIKTTNGYGILKVRSTTTAISNRVVGGLRIKEIRTHDAVLATNDMVRMYEYLDDVDPTKTSGVLYRMPTYGIAINETGLRFDNANPPGCGGTSNRTIVQFSSDSYLAMSDMLGFDVGYTRVKENFVGNGYKIYNYFHSVQYAPQFGNYPRPPFMPIPSHGTGKLKKEAAYNSSNTLLSSMENFNQTENYVTNAFPIYKIMTSVHHCETGGCNMIEDGSHIAALVTKYEIWNTPYRLDYVVNMLDGVTTTTDYSYDPLNKILAPTAVTFTNSDGQVNKTEYRYPTTLAFECLRNDLINRNLIGQPTSTRNLVGTTLVSADSTRWTNWAGGFPEAACGNTTYLPYPWNYTGTK